ncbi:hypothetical protein MUP95_01600 [bacterium]|nr:hypothetical protein [bacterium]
MAVLKIEQHDEEREIAFELAYQKTLTVQQRLDMLEERRTFFQRQLLRYGHRKPFEIIKRS